MRMVTREAEPEAPVEAVTEEAAEPVATETTKEDEVAETSEAEATDEDGDEDFELTPTSISDLIVKNDNNQMTQKEFFKVLLMGLQQNITTKQKLIEIEKRLEDTDSRLEKLEVVEKAASEAPTEPEPVPATEEAPVEEAVEAPTEPEPVP